MRFLFISIFLFCYCLIFSQNVEIKVRDKSEHSPVAFAVVSIKAHNKEKVDHYYCNEYGIVSVLIKDTSLVTVYNIGYRKDSALVIPGIKNYIFELENSDFALDEIVVTGQHKPTSVDKSIYNIKLIGVQQIERKAATDLVSQVK